MEPFPSPWDDQNVLANNMQCPHTTILLVENRSRLLSIEHQPFCSCLSNGHERCPCEKYGRFRSIWFRVDFDFGPTLHCISIQQTYSPSIISRSLICLSIISLFLICLCLCPCVCVVLSQPPSLPVWNLSLVWFWHDLTQVNKSFTNEGDDGDYTAQNF